MIFLVECRNVSLRLMDKLKIDKCELYNLLKYIRNNMNISLLGIHNGNVIDIIDDIYRNNYIHEP